MLYNVVPEGVPVRASPGKKGKFEDVSSAYCDSGWG